MKRFKTIGISVLIAACAVCLSLAFVACKGGDDKNANYGAGEEGFYYYDGANSARYMLSLQSGTYMITANNETAYSGSYDYDEESGEISFTGDATFTATMGENALSLDMTGSGYSFKAYKYFDVTYVDENGNTVATESVLNGQSAEAITVEKDGYYFIGWYEDSSNSSEFAFNTSIAGDTTVYGWYIAINENTTDFAVTLDYGDGYTETEATMNGAVWSLPSSYNGSGILGWWVSATNKSGELTYKYNTGDVFTADTTLFAVYSGMGASVTSAGITWENVTGFNVYVSIYDDNGDVLSDFNRANVSSTTAIYAPAAFTSLATGTYTIKLESGNVTEYLTYVVNGLERVSMSSADIVVNGSGRVLSFVPVDNATRYEITVSDGERTVTENLGSRTYYNFSDWEMTKDGITFTVTAYADGYVSSVSDAYNYLLVLESVTIDVQGNDVVWSRAENALEYEVVVFNGGKEIDRTRTTDTSYSLKYYDAGDYTISVQPMSDGYWSEASTYYGYAKSSIAAPEITDITNYSVSWSEVIGATSYVVSVNEVEYKDIEGTTLVFSDSYKPATADRYEISVKAVGTNGNDSSYSDVVIATENSFESGVSYNRNTVSWNYDIAAAKYEISVNGKVTTVTEGNSKQVELTKVGDNDITVTAYDSSDTVIGYASITVYAYSVTLDGNGANTEKDVVYVAQGDTLNLGTASLDHADFMGWYTQADYTEGQSDEYEGKGSLVLDGSTFTGNRNTYLYAYYSYEWVDVTLVVGIGLVDDGNGDKVDTLVVPIKYNSTSYVFPTPTPNAAEDIFMGWYSESNGLGTQYAGTDGKFMTAFAGETKIYAYYYAYLYYTRTTYNGETVYAVSAGSTISSITSVTVPEQYIVNGVGYNVIVNSNAFYNCKSLEVLNLPDTVLYIAVTNGGYIQGTGAFVGCSSLKEVNIYATGEEPDSTKEVTYFSEDGVLFRKISTSETGDVELLYYPYAKKIEADTENDIAAGEYHVPETVSDENECDAFGNLVTHNVTTIPTQVFRDRDVTKVVFPKTVTSIVAGAFFNNEGLTSVVFEEGGTDNLILEDRAFRGCTGLTQVTLPSRYTDFNVNAFVDCTALTNILIDVDDNENEGVYRSEDGVVLGNTNDTYSTLIYYPIGRSGVVDTSTITQVTNITKIGTNAFGENINITSVTISATVIEIGESAFENLARLETLTFSGTDNSSDLTIKTRAFYGCILLTEVQLPSNLTIMEKDAFGGCINLLTVRYDARNKGENGTADNLQFADGAFGSTNYVSTLELGANVPEIDFVAIFDGGNLTSVVIDDGNKYFMSDDYGAVYSADGTTIHYYPRARVGAYVMLDTATAIAADIFAGRTGLTSITIGAGVNSIADLAFSGCTYLEKIEVATGNTNYTSVDGVLYKLADGVATELVYCPIRDTVKEITVPEAVTSVAASAFENNVTVTSVTFSTTGTFTMGSSAFSGASALTSVTLPSGLTAIPDKLFYNCSKLVSVNIPTGVVTIGESAFEGCTLITGSSADNTSGIALPDGLTTIGKRAFYNCQNLAVSIPASVTTIDEYAFYQCWYTTTNGEITFASVGNNENEGTELTIGNYAFYNAVHATSVEIPARAASVGNFAFYGFGKSIGTNDGAVVTFETGSELLSVGNCSFQGANISTIVLPASVTSIGYSAFYQCSYLASVKFAPDGETSQLSTIGSSAFNSVSKLTEITIPASVTYIDQGAFCACYLEEITIEGGEVPLYIVEDAFASNSITEITIPARVYGLEKTMFRGNTELTTVTFESDDTLEEKLTYIDMSMFDECTELANVTLPTYLVSIEQSAFSGCNGITSISIPETVTTIGAQAFQNCTGLEEVNFETNATTGLCSLSKLGDSAFNGCTALKSFEFPATTAEQITLGTSVFTGSGITSLTLTKEITDVGKAFQGTVLESIDVAPDNTSYMVGEDKQILYSKEGTIVCIVKRLSGEYTIPEGIVSIGDSAFYGQTGLTSITIPSTVSSIGSYAFAECSNLVTVKFSNIESSQMNNASLSTSGYQFNNCKKLANVELPATVTALPSQCFCYCDMTGNVDFLKNITEVGASAMQYTQITEYDFSNVTSIGNFGFAYTNLVSIELPDTLTSMGTYVFYRCYDLVSVKLPSTLTAISGYAFQYCSALKSIEIPDTCTTIDNYAFQYCYALETVVLPDDVNKLSVRLFSDCTSLREINLPAKLVTLDNFVFYNCPSLTSITLPDTLTSIGASTFYGCTSLESIDFGDNLTSIGNQAFYNCYALETVSVGNKVTSLGTQVFRNCTGLTYAYTGYSITSIPDNTFRGCTSLVTVELGPVVSTIGTNVFDSCSSLVEITLEQGLNSIGSSAFASCESLDSIIIPASVTTISSSAFTGCECEIFVRNTINYATTNWSGWATGFEGTIYYYSQFDPGFSFNEDATGYDAGYWYYDENGEMAVWSFDDMFTIYTADDGNYVLYSNGAIVCICFVETTTETDPDTEEETEITTITICMAAESEVSSDNEYTVTLENGDSYTVVLDETDMTVTITSVA